MTSARVSEAALSVRVVEMVAPLSARGFKLHIIMIKSPEQINIHDRINNDVLSIVSSVINLS